MGFYKKKTLLQELERFNGSTVDKANVYGLLNISECSKLSTERDPKSFIGIFRVKSNKKGSIPHNYDYDYFGHMNTINFPSFYDPMSRDSPRGMPHKLHSKQSNKLRESALIERLSIKKKAKWRQ